MGLGMDSDKAWAICNASIDEVEKVLEHHSPLDIVGGELKETVCKPCTQEKSLKADILNSKLR